MALSIATNSKELLAGEIMSYPTLFNEKRTAQAAAFMLHSAGGRLPLLKLMKLLYLAERESLRLFGEPISGDKLVSMPHGPVLSKTLDMMNGWGGDAQVVPYL